MNCLHVKCKASGKIFAVFKKRLTDKGPAYDLCDSLGRYIKTILVADSEVLCP